MPLYIRYANLAAPSPIPRPAAPACHAIASRYGGRPRPHVPHAWRTAGHPRPCSWAFGRRQGGVRPGHRPL